MADVRLCASCGKVDLSACHHLRRYCFECGCNREKDTGGRYARNVANRAVASGELPDPKTLTCVDCGEPAEQYDHRDYGRPLDVVPVCHLCNYRRGPGLSVRKAA